MRKALKANWWRLPLVLVTRVPVMGILVILSQIGQLAEKIGDKIDPYLPGLDY